MASVRTSVKAKVVIRWRYTQLTFIGFQGGRKNVWSERFALDPADNSLSFHCTLKPSPAFGCSQNSSVKHPGTPAGHVYLAASGKHYQPRMCWPWVLGCCIVLASGKLWQADLCRITCSRPSVYEHPQSRHSTLHDLIATVGNLMHLPSAKKHDPSCQSNFNCQLAAALRLFSMRIGVVGKTAVFKFILCTVISTTQSTGNSTSTGPDEQQNPMTLFRHAKGCVQVGLTHTSTSQCCNAQS